MCGAFGEDEKMLLQSFCAFTTLRKELLHTGIIATQKALTKNRRLHWLQHNWHNSHTIRAFFILQGDQQMITIETGFDI